MALQALLSFFFVGVIAAESQMIETGIELQPGQWNWSHESIHGQENQSTGGEVCLDEAIDALIATQTILKPSARCSFMEVSNSGGRPGFAVACDGNVTAQGKGRLVQDEDGQITAHVSGYADAYGFMVPFTMIVTAEYAGECKAD